MIKCSSSALFTIKLLQFLKCNIFIDKKNSSDVAKAKVKEITNKNIASFAATISQKLTHQAFYPQTFTKSAKKSVCRNYS